MTHEQCIHTKTLGLKVDEYEEKADEGNGLFAIAAALMLLTYEIRMLRLSAQGEEL